MIDESLQEQAALYASGALSAREREQFELILRFHPELRSLVAEFEEVTAAATVATLCVGGPRPCPTLKARLLGMLHEREQQCPSTHEGFVITGPDGLVQWVNPAFIEMCGYSLEELRGRKLGPILQGEKTDKIVAERMRRAVHEYRPCVEKIVNYHKDGAPYWVEIAITPIVDDAGEPRWLVARERELTDLAAA
jgi:PAS domain S-box-containing protein